MIQVKNCTSRGITSLPFTHSSGYDHCRNKVPPMLQYTKVLIICETTKYNHVLHMVSVAGEKHISDL